MRLCEIILENTILSELGGALWGGSLQIGASQVALLPNGVMRSIDVAPPDVLSAQWIHLVLPVLRYKTGSSCKRAGSLRATQPYLDVSFETIFRTLLSVWRHST